MGNYHAEVYEAYLVEEEQAKFAGLRSAELQYMASSMLRVYEEEILVLQKRIREIKSIYNSGASINELLPNELLMQIFREVNPRAKPVDALRLTHVCRSWRLLLHGDRIFWTDFLDPYEEIVGRGGKDLPTVRMAFERSAPVPGLRFTLTGAFLPSLRSISMRHVSRISTLALDCTAARSWDMHAFFDLQFPHLEDLSVWLMCKEARVPANPSLPAPSLRRLRTNCVTFALRWIKPSLHEVTIGQRWKGWNNKDDISWAPCCTLRETDHLWSALRATCVSLKELRLHRCISGTATRPRDPPLDLPSLENLVIIAKGPHTVCALLQCMKLPATAKVTLVSRHRYYEVGSPVHGAGVPCIRDIGAVSIHIKPHPQISGDLVYRYLVGGHKQVSDQGFDVPLKLYSYVHGSPREISMDISRFFQSAMSVFLPHMISRLTLCCTDPFPPDVNKGWLWLFQQFPYILHLDINIPSSADVFVALAEEGVLPQLRYLTLHTDTDSTAVADETMVSVLAERASRGLRLQDFKFVRRAYSEEESRAVMPMPEIAWLLVLRLETIIPRFSFHVEWGPRGHSGIKGSQSLQSSAQQARSLFLTLLASSS
ncbi:hypothetical protein L226DRAFT_320536 [Lentinus tigrinus ALCF2SS1-7]|uniref:uncharacterized protein n=1 Tax=Lentinus tigrinus ALCF2SS1-7 TaxID=1328758 RepID=UPI001165F984|nr:hypothetical protein L226DRAFT_320536 [Lentinus tigrinus ALCF2SS1-7]